MGKPIELFKAVRTHVIKVAGLGAELRIERRFNGGFTGFKRTLQKLTQVIVVAMVERVNNTVSIE